MASTLPKSDNDEIGQIPSFDELESVYKNATSDQLRMRIAAIVNEKFAISQIIERKENEMNDKEHSTSQVFSSNIIDAEDKTFSGAEQNAIEEGSNDSYGENNTNPNGESVFSPEYTSDTSCEAASNCSSITVNVDDLMVPEEECNRDKQKTGHVCNFCKERQTREKAI